MRIRITACLSLILFLFTACEKWLDLRPEDEAIEKDIFSTAEGYRSVLNGLYKNMGTAALYGRSLSFGFLDCISQQYDLSDAYMSDTKYQSAAQFKYDQVAVSADIQNIWLAAYNIIANANNLIQNIEKADTNIFQHGVMERDLIMGEAYACRALMHFDLLRLFAPAPVNDDGGKYIPYVEKYPDIQAPAISVEECLKNVVRDLLKGRELLQTFDTTELAMNAVCSGGGRFYNEFAYWTDLEYQPDLLEDFLKGRGYRLNYYSVNALLARVYQYAGMHDEAGELAEEVLGYTYIASDWDHYVFYQYDAYGLWAGTGQDAKSFEMRKDLRQVENLIFAIYNENAYENLNLEHYFPKKLSGMDKANCFAVNLSGQNIFMTSDGVDESGDDYRSSRLIFLANSRIPVSGKWFWHDDQTEQKRNVTILPVIRATEMQYIAAEAYARRGEYGEARRLLSNIRRERNCYNPISVAGWDDFVNQLVIDARREWISEGQLFYLYKRLDAIVDLGNGTKRQLTRAEAVVPRPDSQLF